MVGGTDMNFSEMSRKAKVMKKRYPVGTRVELIEMNDPYSKLTPGEKGTVRVVDDIGTVHVNWDCGSSLGLVPGEDSFRTI